MYEKWIWVQNHWGAREETEPRTETTSEEEAFREEQGWEEEAAAQGGHLSYYCLSGIQGISPDDNDL